MAGSTSDVFWAHSHRRVSRPCLAAGWLCRPISDRGVQSAQPQTWGSGPLWKAGADACRSRLWSWGAASAEGDTFHQGFGREAVPCESVLTVTCGARGVFSLLRPSQQSFRDHLRCTHERAGQGQGKGTAQGDTASPSQPRTRIRTLCLQNRFQHCAHHLSLKHVRGGCLGSGTPGLSSASCAVRSCRSLFVPQCLCRLLSVCSPSGPGSRELRAQDLGALPNELCDGG